MFIVYVSYKFIHYYFSQKQEGKPIILVLFFVHIKNSFKVIKKSFQSFFKLFF